MVQFYRSTTQMTIYYRPVQQVCSSITFAAIQQVKKCKNPKKLCYCSPLLYNSCSIFHKAFLLDLHSTWQAHCTYCENVICGICVSYRPPYAVPEAYCGAPEYISNQYFIFYLLSEHSHSFLFQLKQTLSIWLR